MVLKGKGTDATEVVSAMGEDTKKSLEKTAVTAEEYGTKPPSCDVDNTP